MYLIPVLYLIVSTLSPGPVTVLTVHNTARYGRLVGMSVGWGGAVTSAVFAAVAVVLTFNVNTLNVSVHNTAHLWRQGGAIFILMMGLLAGYRSLFCHQQAMTKTPPSNHIVKGFLTGMILMSLHFPQAILYYTVILPHYTIPAHLSRNVLLMGLFKIVITIGWYSALALAAKPIQEWLLAAQVQRFLQFSVSCLLVGISISSFIG